MGISIKNISKSYDEKMVLQNFSLELRDGGIYCLMGPSGVGKTTLLRILMGLEQADCGSIGQAEHGEYRRSRRTEQAGEKEARKWKHSECGNRTFDAEENARSEKIESSIQNLQISAVFQENRLLDFADAVKNIRFVESKQGLLFQPEEILEHLLDKNDWYRPVRDLSGGMQRRVAIGRALAARSDLLLMDEPFTGLDEGTKERVIQTVLKYRGGRTLLVVTHQEEDARLLGAEIAYIKT